MYAVFVHPAADHTYSNGYRPTRTIRSIECPTLAEAVMLTIGLACTWTITYQSAISTYWDWRIDSNSDTWIENNGSLGYRFDYERTHWKRYQHSIRSIVCKWVARKAKTMLMDSDDRSYYRWLVRLSDRQLLGVKKELARDLGEDYDIHTTQLARS